MLKPKIFLAPLFICVLLSSCYQPASLQTLNRESSNSAGIPYSNQISPSIINIINSPDEMVSSSDFLKEDDVNAEYWKHTLFLTAIDKTGSSVEEVLEHDGYKNAAKYLTFWRDLTGENADWPDSHSTTYQGKKPAFEHGLMSNGTGWFWYRSAAQKADEYFSRAVFAWHKDAAPDAPEQKEAWEWLGRSSHFIQDVTVPHHTVTLARFGQLTHDPFENAVVKTFPRYFPSLNYDGGVWSGKGPYPPEEKWGIYFESRLPSEVIKNNADIARGLFKISKHKEDEANGNWDKVRALVIPLATKTTAGLVVSFLHQVGVNPN